MSILLTARGNSWSRFPQGLDVEWQNLTDGYTGDLFSVVDFHTGRNGVQLLAFGSSHLG